MTTKMPESTTTDQMDIEEAIAATFEQSVQSRYLDADGREIPNPVPMQPPVGYRKQPTIAEQMRAMIRQASLEAAQSGMETEEEANDFDVDDEYDPTSPWEHDFDPDPAMEVMLARQSAKPKAPSTAKSEAPKEPSQSSVPAAPAGGEDNT